MEYLSERRFKAKKLIDELKEKTPCVDCKQTFPAICMDFDHLNDKFKNISQMLQKYSVKRIFQEVSKCEIVCSNCHRIRTHDRLLASGQIGKAV